MPMVMCQLYSPTFSEILEVTWKGQLKQRSPTSEVYLGYLDQHKEGQSTTSESTKD